MVRASIVVIALVGVSLAGLACKKRESPPFSSNDQRWAAVKDAAKRTMAVTDMGKLDSLEALLQLAKRKQGVDLTCEQPAPPGTRKLVTAALAKAKDARAPELHAVIYLARLLRENGSGLISLMLGSYVARKVVAWAAENKITRIDTQPLRAEEEQRALAADALCVWKRQPANNPGAKVLRGYLETIAFAKTPKLLKQHQHKAFIYQGDFPALTRAPRGYHKYIRKAASHRAAFNALTKGQAPL